MISLPRASNGIRRFKKREEKKRITYNNIEVEQEEKISNISAIAIIKTLFIRTENGENFNINGINLLLEISKDNVKFRTLTTLLYMLKNIEKLKVVYCKQDEKKSEWIYKNRKSNKTLAEEQN